LSHRSAFEYRPTSSGDVFLTYGYERKIKLPGVTLNMLAGEPPIEGDNIIVDGLHVSQQASAFLENLQSTRRPGPSSKTMSLPEIEGKLEQIVRSKGEDGLNALRDRAREIAPETKMEKE